jgi:hypothetical protein
MTGEKRAQKELGRGSIRFLRFGRAPSMARTAAALKAGRLRVVVRVGQTQGENVLGLQASRARPSERRDVLLPVIRRGNRGIPASVRQRWWLVTPLNAALSTGYPGR